MVGQGWAQIEDVVEDKFLSLNTVAFWVLVLTLR